MSLNFQEAQTANELDIGGLIFWVSNSNWNWHESEIKSSVLLVRASGIVVRNCYLCV